MTKIKREWQTLEKKLMYENPWLKIYEDKIVQPNGKKGIYGYLDKGKGVFVIAQDKDQSVYMLEEYRYVVKKSIIQLPAGGSNDQDTMNDAKRELKEETGITAKTWKFLGNFYIAPGHETTTIDAYLATDLDISNLKISGQEGDESILNIFKVNMNELKEMIRTNKIECGITLAALNLFFVVK
jgi:8-oxo-dGTP pyrophosphatase MutT (NUDIX family)